MKTFRLGALVAGGLLASGLAATTASAADLGGNCCADLEERVADLEATTARKGNRKVSLTITGWVAEQIAFWDDSKDSGVYIGSVGTTLATNVKFLGEATISPGITAGYLIHIEAIGADTLVLSQDKSTGTLTPAVNVFQSYWFLQSKDLGKLSLGLISHASDNAAIYPDGSGTLVPANWVVTFDGLSFFARNRATGNRTNLQWGPSLFNCAHINAGIAADCNGVPREAVRFDTPTYQGFSFSTSAGQDKYWDVTGRWAGEHSGFKLSTAASYSDTDDRTFAGIPSGTKHSSGYFQWGGYIEHVATGLFVYGAYGKEFNRNSIATTFNGANVAFRDDDHFYVKPGVRATGLLPLGHTVFWGEYYQSKDMLGAQSLGQGFTSGTGRYWGLGVLQEVDAAALSVWIKYRNAEGDLSCGAAACGTAGGNTTTAAGGKLGLDNFQTVVVGALIAF